MNALRRAEVEPVVVSLLTGDRWEAEDVAQEALARAWVRWGRIGTLDRPDLWARRVAVNISRSVWRRRQVAARASTNLAGAGRPAPMDAMPEDGLLLEAVSTLPERQRSAIVLRYFRHDHRRHRPTTPP